MDTQWKVGALARATGLSVRTLHHYDELGLVRPSRRTPSGHRLYDGADVERLYRVRALRQLGVPLDRIAEGLDGTASLGDVLDEHAAFLDASLARLLAARSQVAVLRRPGRAVGTEDLLELIESVVTMDDVMNRYFDEAQMARLAERREQIGTDEIARVEAAWPDLMARVQTAMDAGVDPASDEAGALASEWSGLLEAFHGGDPELEASLFAMYEENTEQMAAEHGGPPAAMVAWVGRAQAAHG